VRTLVIQIGDAGDAGYPVKLFFDDGSDGWRETPRAEGTVPAELPDPALPPVPGQPAAEGGEPAVPEALRSALLHAAQPAHDLLGRVGVYLYELLTAGQGVAPVAAAWDELRAAYPGEVPPSEGLLTVFDVRPAALRQLPWELLNRDGERLFADAGNPCVRGRFPFKDPPAADELAPLRVLLVVGDLNDPKLAAGEELAALASAIAGCGGRIHHEELVGPSREELFERVRLLRPHVFHFIGHGRLSPGTRVPVLELVQRSTGERRELEHDDVRTGFKHTVPRLVVLNACRTSETLVQAGVWSVADAFVKLGAAAVVSMQGDVDAGAAVRFTGALYTALGRGTPVDQAVAAGRTAIWEETGLKRRDWALPSLHLAVEPARVLGVGWLPAERLSALEKLPELRELRTFVDRGHERRTLWWGVDDPSPRLPGAGAAPAGGLALVTGRAGAGKTSLTRSCLLTCSVRGRRVAHVDLGGERRKDWLGVLYAIRDGSGRTGLQGALPAAAFGRFNHEVGWLAKGEEPPPAPAGPPEPAGVAPRPPFTAESEHAPAYIERIFALFREALRAAAGDQPLIVALDHLDGVLDDHVTRYLAPLLLRPALDGGLAPVRLIVVLDDREVGLVPDDLREAAWTVPVPRFPGDAFTALVREYVARKGHPAERWAAWKGLIGELQKITSAEWNPADLAMVETLLSGRGDG
jgi:hypothetical protein